jgi:hypothetical protein
MPEKETLPQRIRPHVEFEVLKEVLKHFYLAYIAGSAMIATLSTFFHGLAHWQLVFGVIFLLSLCTLIFIGWVVARSERFPPTNQKDDSSSIPAVSPDPVSLLFSPLQLEAFQLAKELREFFIGLGPRPDLNKGLVDGTEEGGRRALQGLLTRQKPWCDEIIHGYELQFAARVSRIKHLFGAKGLGNRAFEDVEHLGITQEETIPELARKIDRLAVDVNYTDLHKLECERDLARGGF